MKDFSAYIEGWVGKQKPASEKMIEVFVNVENVNWGDGSGNGEEGANLK